MGTSDQNLEKHVSNYGMNRIEWIDQLRGICILLYIIAIMTWGLSGDIMKEILPIGATYLNHGYAISAEFFNKNPFSFPPIITIIDLGQPVLVFLVGFMQSFSFSKRSNKYGKKNAWNHTFYRFLIILFFSIFFEDMILSHGLYISIFDGTFANLAWASLFGGISAGLIKEGDKRVIIGFCIMLIHTILYSIPGYNTVSFGKNYYIFHIPFRMINLSAISIVASGYTTYFFNFNESGDWAPSMNKIGIKKRVLPLIFIMFISNYVLDYLIWADQRTCTISFAFLAIAVASLSFFIFYQFDLYNFKIPFLSALGKNMWLIFLFSPIFEWILIQFVEEIVRANKILALLLVGILPIITIAFIAKFLEKKKILIKI